MASLTLATRSERPQLLRRDVTGRVRISRGGRELLLAEFDRSGVSAAVFAGMAGIKYQTFAGWLHVRRRGGWRNALKHAGTRQQFGVVPICADPRAAEHFVHPGELSDRGGGCSSGGQASQRRHGWQGAGSGGLVRCG
jgi:hypothetical protein